MPDQPTIIQIVAEDYYWSETLQQHIYPYHCPNCATFGFVTQSGDVNRCSTCGTFLRIVNK